MARGRKSSWPPGPEREVFTTGEVARLCRVTPKTVIRWIDSGRLKGYRIPDSRDRRVTRGELIAFMREHDIPLREVEDAGGRRRILIVDDDASVLEVLRTFLDALGLFELDTASNGYEAGVKTFAFRPHLLLIDYNLGDVTGADVARTVRADRSLAAMKIICMSGFLSEEEGRKLGAFGVDDFVRKPVDLQDLRQRIYGHLALV